MLFLSSSGTLLRKLVGVMHEQLGCKCLAVQMSDADLTKCLEMQHNQLTFWNAWFFNTFDTGISMDAEVGWGKLGFFERCLLSFGSYSKIVIFIWLEQIILWLFWMLVDYSVSCMKLIGFFLSVYCTAVSMNMRSKMFLPALRVFLLPSVEKQDV